MNQAEEDRLIAAELYRRAARYLARQPVEKLFVSVDEKLEINPDLPKRGVKRDPEKK